MPEAKEKQPQLIGVLDKYFHQKDHDVIVVTLILEVTKNTKGVLIGISPDFRNPRVMAHFVKSDERTDA